MFTVKNVAFYTLGCKLNFSEISTISRQLADIGFKKTKFKEEKLRFINLIINAQIEDLCIQQ